MKNNKFINFLLFIMIFASLSFQFSEDDFLPPQLPDENLGNVQTYLVSSNNSPLERITVCISINETKLYRNTDRFGILNFQIPNGQHSIYFIADNINTPAEDYISENITFFVNKETNFKTIMFPVGRIIIDTTPETELNISCYTTHPLQEQTINSDKNGKSSVMVPTGKCKIKSKEGITNVNVTHGQIVTITQPDEQLFNLTEIIIGLFILISILIMLRGLYFIYQRHNENKDIKVRKYIEGNETPLSNSLKNLSKTEEKIVKLLMSKGGIERQSQLIKDLNISRATFFREIKKLKTKKIINKNRKGMNIIIEITPVFLNVFKREIEHNKRI